MGFQKNNIFIFSWLIIFLFLLMIPSQASPDSDAFKPASDAFKPAPDVFKSMSDLLKLTVEEKIWLNRIDTITIGGPLNFPPFHFFESDSELNGISADYISAIMDMLGIKVAVRKNIPWQQLLDETRAGQVDLIPCIAKNSEREEFLIFSEPYLSFPLVIITRRDAPFMSGISDIQGRRLAVVKKNITISLLENDGIDFIAHHVPSTLDALRAVSFGSADLNIENLATFTYFVRKYGLTNLKVAAPTPYGNYNLHMAVRKDIPELASIINKAIAAMPQDTHNNIRNRWLGVRYEHGISIADVIKWVSVTALLAMTVLSVILLWNKRLQREILERKRIQANLKESEEHLRTLINSMTDIVCFKDREGRWLEANEVCLDFFNLVNVPYRGKKTRELAELTPFYRETFLVWQKRDEKAWRAGGVTRRDEKFSLPDGTLRIFDVIKTPIFQEDGTPKALVAVGRDITEKSKMEHQLYHAQKFEAIGTLAGGIAHDFNNLLMTIQGRTSLVMVDMEDFDPHMDHLRAIEKCIKSATDLTRQLLGFARGGKYQLAPIDINGLVNESSAMFGRTRKEISIHTRFHSPPPAVMADMNQIRQVMLNLYINAWQAMPGGGEIFLETNLTDLDGPFCKPQEISPGTYVKISVTDTGTGMEKEILQRIFDPFFTTREKNRGTGLGLASAYGIIKNHGGVITVYSEPGHGSTFNIYMPLCLQEPERETDESFKKITISRAQASETILLIDDEEMITEVGKAMLETMGYQVITAGDGREGVEIFQSRSQNIDLVILDMIMPVMDGEEAFERIREISPEVPVILSSGYSATGKTARILERGCNDFIQKPFNIEEFSKKIKTILDARSQQLSG
ncbi:MAG: transporter substrate-binding domain-containing protein [Desulfamplus sp.]|nr:transporter substrate-binding domain-containing protein [Desulfamplus sp.]